VQLLYSKIGQVSKRLSNASQPASIEIVCKDFLVLDLLFQSDSDATELFEVVSHYSQPSASAVPSDGRKR
jgi:hypothetical protein